MSIAGATQPGISSGRVPHRRWIWSAPAATLLLMAFCTPLPAADLFFDAQTRDDRWSWGYCAPPYPPACVDQLSKAPKDRTSCEKEIDSYVANVFRYRGCLSAETERAVREANRVLQIMKCPRDERYCYDLPQAGASSNRSKYRR